MVNRFAWDRNIILSWYVPSNQTNLFLVSILDSALVWPGAMPNTTTTLIEVKFSLDFNIPYIGFIANAGNREKTSA